jgi:RHS repeat-associated protein
LNGVTVDGTLDVGNTYTGTSLTVTNGLTLNGTALVGNPTDSAVGGINFAGTQGLNGSGTVVFGNYPYNALLLAYEGTMLTIGSGITVHGQNGTIGYSPSYWGGATNVAIINQGTISADVSGGSISINAQPFNNQGLAQAINGATLFLNDTWNNSGTLVESGGTIYLGGNFTMENVGALSLASGTVYLSGSLTNMGTTLMINATSTRWVLKGGTIVGGTVAAASGVSLYVNGSVTLNGVTFDGILDVGSTYDEGILTVTNGLVLNGTALVGNPTNGSYGYINFAGSQTLSGSATVVFGNFYDGSYFNALRLTSAGTTLTIGPGITIKGQNGMVGYDPYWGGPQNVAVINQGTIWADVTSGTITINGQSFTNQGSLSVSAGATLSVAAAASFNNPNALMTQAGGKLQISSNLLGNTQNVDQWLPQGTLSFTSGAHEMEAMSVDLGNVPGGYEQNFAYGTISLASGAQVTLVDQSTNSAGPLPECVYTTSLIVPSGSTLNLNGLHLYAGLTQIAGTVAGGTVSQAVNNGGPLTLGGSVPGNIPAAGALDDFTFFARGGDYVTILVDTGSASVPSPPLKYALVQLFDPSSNILAHASNTVAQQIVGLTNIILPVDGTYTVAIRAPLNQSASTGNYLVTAWDAPPRIASLVVNQQAYGQITTPFTVDQWNFSASAGEQVEFNLLNAGAPGVAFNLIGPQGWVGFSNLATSSSLVTLPYSGNYLLTAFGTGGAYGFAYTFELAQTAQTNLAEGSTYSGSFAGNGQAQLIAVNVTNAGPLLITLNNAGAKNVTGLYAQFGSPPTLGVFGSESVTPNSSSQQILIPQAYPGIYYVLVYGNLIATPGSYTLATANAEMFVTSVFPSHLGNQADATLTLAGAGFLPGTTVSAVSSNGTAYPAASVSVNSFSQMTFTFASNTVPAGLYSMAASLPDGVTSTLTNAFEFTGGGQGKLAANLILPGFLGRHGNTLIYVQYANTGTAALPAPLLAVSGSQGTQPPIMTLAAGLTPQQLVASHYGPVEPPGWSATVQFLASGRTPGVLQPGETNIVTIAYGGLEQPWDFAVNTVTMNLGVLTETNNSPVDWAAFESSLQPAAVSNDVWGAVWQNFTNQMGPTWGSIITKLNQDSSYFGTLGLNVTDLGQLFSFELMRANGLTLAPYLASAIDAIIPSPGLQLSFQRVFAQRLYGRYRMGALGRGWSHNWDISLSVATNGSVNVAGPAELLRTFLPDSRGGYFSSAGDFGTLTTPNNIFTLQEANGAVHVFNSNGQLAYTSDPNGNRITCGYTGAQLTSLTHSSGQQLTMTYNAAGCIAGVTDSAGDTTSFTYDATGQHLVSATQPGGPTLTYAYTDSPSASTNAALAHALTSVTFPDGTHQYFTYDNQGRLASSSRDGGAETLDYSYDANGTIFTTDAFANATLSYLDQRGFPLTTQNPLNESYYAAFDPNGNVTSLTDPTGKTSMATYDAYGNLLQSVDALGDITSLSYAGPLRNLTSIEQSSGATTTLSNDANGNLLSMVYPDNNAEQWTYDSTGDALSWQNRRGQTIQYTRNAGGQITRKSYPDGRVMNFSYDARGLLTNATDSAQGTTSLGYDARAFLTNISYPNGKSFTFLYDESGLRVGRIGEDGYTLNYGYDAAGRLETLSNSVNGLLVQYTYDANGRLAFETKGNGTFATYSYDAAGEILTITNFSPGGALQSFFDYSYDSKGNRVSMTTASGSTIYAYDAMNQLIAVTYPNGRQVAYTYDSSGNRTAVNDTGTNTTYSVNSLNQYTQAGGTGFVYDADGNLASQIDSNGTTTYQYDAENRLIGVISPTNGIWQFTYDVLGNRSLVVTNGVTNQYVYDPFALGNLATACNAAGAIVDRYDDALGLVSRIDASGDVSFYSFDALRSTSAVTGDDGAILDSYEYDAFGAATVVSGADDNPFRFVGGLGVLDDMNGLQFMRQRYFASCEGRFITSDPVRFSGGDINLYRYGVNNPINLIDPVGLKIFTIGGPKGWEVLYAINEDGSQYVGVGRGDGWGAYVNADTGAISIDIITKYIASIAYDPGDVTPGLNVSYRRNLPFPNGLGGELDWNCTDRNLQLHPTFGVGYDKSAVVVFPLDPLLKELEAPWTPMQSLISSLVSSGDPNQLIGPAGFAAQNYITDSGLFAYQILFENDTNATAPAQIVEINDPLSTNLNWATFQLTGISFGDQFISLPPNAQNFQTNLPFSYDGVNFELVIDAGINLSNGQVFASFNSIDPATGLPPAVNIGFLPPEDGTGRGMGQISYFVMPQPNLPTGTLISNVAYIQFDENPVIATDQVSPTDPTQGVDTNKQALVTIDSTPPVSSVGSLPEFETSTNFAVCWSGTTAGAPIVAYDIYVSTNSGPWTAWLAGATNTCATFNGLNGNSYGFYSVAHDGAGLVEAPHLTADATTTVQAVLAGPPPSLTIALTGQQVFLAWPTNAGNYFLQTTTNLSSQSIWNVVTNTPSVMGSSNAVTLPVTITSQFFRLQNQ